MGKFDFFLENTADAEEFAAKHKTYSELKRSELENIPEDEIVAVATGWIEGKFDENWSDMCKVVNDLPTPCLNIYFADHVAKEVMSGGFSEAVFNLSNDFLGIAANGFRAIGYEKLGEIVDAAVKAGAGNRPSGRSFEDFLEFSESVSFSAQDKDFRRCFDKAKFDRLAKQYIINYSKYFGND